MKDLQFMKWDECTKKHLRHVEKDNEKIESILALAEKRLKFIEAIAINQEKGEMEKRAMATRGNHKRGMRAKHSGMDRIRAMGKYI